MLVLEHRCIVGAGHASVCITSSILTFNKVAQTFLSSWVASRSLASRRRRMAA